MTASPAGLPDGIGRCGDRPIPRSVSYARFLLYLQASIWGLIGVVVTLVAVVPLAASPPGGLVFALSHDPALAFGVAGIAAALATAKAWLGRRISRKPVGLRPAVIVVECLMTCLGLVLCLLTATMDGGFIPFCCSFVGGTLSLVAVIGLARPPARQYLVPHGDKVPQANSASMPGDGGEAPFWHLTPGLPLP